MKLAVHRGGLCGCEVMWLMWLWLRYRVVGCMKSRRRYVCVCMYACMHVCMHVCMYGCIHVCMDVCKVGIGSTLRLLHAMHASTSMYLRKIGFNIDSIGASVRDLAKSGKKKAG